ncbi:MAG: HAMP domain-containing histidine kinase [Elusimicrobia bacterium]|nr:HAMP domain-containing histidine kinase [Elusimicrobiota bacterium]
MKLGAKLTLLLSGLSLAVACAALLVFTLTERHHLRLQASEERQAALEKLARVCAESFVGENELALRTFVASSPPRHATEMALVDVKGRVVIHVDFAKNEFTFPDKPAKSAHLRKVAGSQKGLWEPFTAEGRRLELGTAVLSAHNGERMGAVAVVYDRDAVESSIASLQRETLRRLMPMAALLIVLSVLLAVALARALAKPIQQLSLAARRIGQGDLLYRIPAQRSDELGDLAREFNAMGVKLKELDELKEGFLSRMTHDLRNPLSAMINQTETVTGGLRGPVTESQNKALRTVIKNGNYLMSLINNILDVTKLEAGKMEFAQSDLDLQAIAGEVVEIARATAAEFKVFIPDPDVPSGTRVWADEQALRRVLMNLVFNALKFTPEGGTVRILWSKTPEGHDRLAVQDTGIGIPADKIKTLFKKFSQIEETKDKVRKTKGTGLGLVICKEIVEAHGGSIWAESEYQKGTTFLFTLLPRPV